jgi:hypothetical protein
MSAYDIIIQGAATWPTAIALLPLPFCLRFRFRFRRASAGNKPLSTLHFESRKLHALQVLELQVLEAASRMLVTGGNYNRICGTG